MKLLINKIRNARWNVAEVLTVLIMFAALMVIALHFYQVRRTIPLIKTVEITDPVKVDKSVYRIGETVIGNFEGERFSDKPAIFHRTLVCKEYRALLKDIRVEHPPIGKIDRASPLLTLNGDIFLIPDIELTTATNCEILFAPETVVDKYILGGEKLQNDQQFRTTKFQIIGENDPYPQTETDTTINSETGQTTTITTPERDEVPPASRAPQP